MPKARPDEDKIYAKPRAQVENFAFDSQVADVFDDMIRRSVPGYAMTLSLLGIIAQRYAQPQTRIYDLGCSLGAGIVAMAPAVVSNVHFVGIDNSQAMLDRCQQNVARLQPTRQAELHCQDIQETPIENASIVVLNFTLQFIPKERREALLARIRQGLTPGGILVLSEKIQFEDDRIQNNMTDLHHDFKRANGYSDLEIGQKRAALEKVLVPETLATHQTRLQRSGFSRSETWLQCFNFASLLAFK